MVRPSPVFGSRYDSAMAAMPSSSSSSSSPSSASSSASITPSTAMANFYPAQPSPLSSSPLRSNAMVTSPKPFAREMPSSSPVSPVSSSQVKMHLSSPIRSASSPPRLFFSSTDTQSSPIALPPPPSLSAAAAESAVAGMAGSAPFSTQQRVEAPPAFGAHNTDRTATANKLSRFASRPAKPLPPRLQQGRDAARQTRRSLFLRNVRQRADERSWDRRNCEQELQKLEWWSLEREIRQARDSDSMGFLTEHDIDDAAEWMRMQPPSFGRDAPQRCGSHHDDRSDRNFFYDDAEADDVDERMADLLAREEEEELEALIATMGTGADVPGHQDGPRATSEPALPGSHAGANDDDDDDYDALFTEILSQQPDIASVGEDTVMD